MRHAFCCGVLYVPGVLCVFITNYSSEVLYSEGQCILGVTFISATRDWAGSVVTCITWYIQFTRYHIYTTRGERHNKT